MATFASQRLRAAHISKVCAARRVRVQPSRLGDAVGEIKERQHRIPPQSVRRAVRTRGHFPSDEAATKLIYLVLHRLTKDWKMPAREWYAARAQFAVLFADRMKAA